MIWLFLRSNWKLVGLLAILAAVCSYIVTLRVQLGNAREKAENIQLAFDQFQAKVRVEGEAAKLKVAQDIAESERAKNETVATLQTRLDAVIRDGRMRDARAASGRGILPTIPPGTTATTRAAFDRTILDDALRSFVEETSGLALEGDGALAIRDGWIDWYRGQVKASE